MARALCLCVLLAAAACSGRAAGDSGRVHVTYDKQGNVTQLAVDDKPDGKPNIYSQVSGSAITLIEVDKDEDGRIDRWEYYGANQKLEKVGLSRSNTGKPDYWVYPGPGGQVSRAEIAGRGDGIVNRTEFYEHGALARVEEDTDRDGRVDKWETYVGGALATVGFDTQHTGRPDRLVDYRR